MQNQDTLHFVIKIRGDEGVPDYNLIYMNAGNRLYVKYSNTLPTLETPKSSAIEKGSTLLDMTKFSHVKLYQVTDSVPKISSIGSTLKGTIFKTKLNAYDLINQKDEAIELSATNEAHMVFNVEYQRDTVNFISLYNYAHDDEVVAMIMKRGTEAQILLFDIRLEVLDLHRQPGRYTFLSFIKNFREAFIRFGEKHHPEGEVSRLSRNWRKTAENVTYDIPDGLTNYNHDHISKLLKELYGLKLILAASLVDRCAKNSDEFKTAQSFLRSYLPRAKTEKKFFNFGQQDITWSKVVFNQAQLDDLFDDMPDEPARLHVGPNENSGLISISKDDLDQAPKEFEDFWHTLKIDPDD